MGNWSVNKAVGLTALLAGCTVADTPLNDPPQVAASQSCADCNEHNEIGQCAILYRASAAIADEETTYSAPFDRERADAFLSLGIAQGLFSPEMALMSDDDVIGFLSVQERRITPEMREPLDQTCAEIASRYEETRHLEFGQ